MDQIPVRGIVLKIIKENILMTSGIKNISLKIFYGSIVDLQCNNNFKCTT